MTAAARMPPPRPLYLDVDDRPVFGTFHAGPEGVAARTAVLICPAWGWDEVTTYRSRRAWAERLAEDGHPTLRIDLPGTGDSAGNPTDPNQVDAWRRAVSAASRWLEGLPDVDRVAAIGMGLGGSIAALAIAEGAPIDDLVLWAAPVRGRAFLREQRAFAALQSSRLGSGDEHAPGLLPKDWLEVGGYVLTSETMAALDLFDLVKTEGGHLRRVLLLGRDGLPVDESLRQHFDTAGVEVTVETGDGWEAMCFDLERYQAPLAVFDQVARWLRPSAQPAPTGAWSGARAPTGPSATDVAQFAVDGAVIRETSIGSDGRLGGSFGILSEPVGSVPAAVSLVFLNAGAIRRIGPNRMWVEAARRWATKGVRTARVDVAGIGDAEGDPEMYADVGRFYTPDREGLVTTILDDLEGRGWGPRFILIGLCAGAYSAFNTAAIDDRVIGVLAFNPKILVWDPDLLARRDALLVKRILEPGSWRRILRGETPISRIVEICRLAVGRATSAMNPRRDRTANASWLHELEGLLDRLAGMGTRVILAFSGDEPLHDEMDAAGMLANSDRWPNLFARELPERDHTLRPIQAQLAGHDVLDQGLAPLLPIDHDPALRTERDLRAGALPQPR